MGQDQKKADSVYDFLYVDHARIQSFLSQFDEYGHLTALTRTTAVTSGKNKGVKGEVKGGILVAGGQASAHRDSTESESSQSQKQYDPRWAAPLSFLDEASDRKMLTRGLTGAAFGQLVLAEGKLSIRDLKIVQKAMSLPVLKKLLDADANQAQAPRHERRKQLRGTGQSGQRQEPKPSDLLEFVTMLPHAIHAELQNSDEMLWCCLKEEYLTGDASDLFLKHGTAIAGTWHVLGIVDAIPGQPDFHDNPGFAGGALADGFDPFQQGFGAALDGLAPFVRPLLGRRDCAYGVTPLLIFREVSPK